MFKNRKLEVRLVKDVDTENTITISTEEPKAKVLDYASYAEDAVVRLGKKLIISYVVTIAAVAAVSVLANAADTLIENAIKK